MNLVIHSHKVFALVESNQKNPIRYHILHKVGQTYTDQSGEFKCKDYMNDIVAKYNGINLCPYGMDFNKIKVNRNGVHLLLTKLVYKDQLGAKLKLLSESAEEDGLPPLKITDVPQGFVIFIDKKYFVSTYVISYLMSCIRICHSDEVVTSIYSMVDQDRTIVYNQDNPFGYQRALIAKNGFLNPCVSFSYLGKTKDDAFIRKYAKDNICSFHGLGIQAIAQTLVCEGVWK